MNMLMDDKMFHGFYTNNLYSKTVIVFFSLYQVFFTKVQMIYVA